MTPVEALDILGQATEPQNIVRLSRLGLVQVQNAIETLVPLVKEWQDKQTKTPDNVVPIGNGT